MLRRAQGVKVFWFFSSEKNFFLFCPKHDHRLNSRHAGPPNTMIIAPAAEIGREVARLFDGVALDLPNPLVYANYGDMGDAAMRRSLLSRNAPRRVELPPVRLISYPPGTIVYGDRSYLAVAGDAIVREQVAPWFTDPLDEARRMVAGPAETVLPPCVLLARYGENTWGHWVAEMLVKAAIAERAAPGRFLYAVPWWTTEPGGQRNYASAVLESLAAYGIGPERLLRMVGLQTYRFAALHDVLGTGGKTLHPGALQTLHAVALSAAAGPPRRKIAVLRRPPLARAVYNAPEIVALLEQHGFVVADLASMRFLDQLRLFTDAEIVVGSLGSDFVGALFAREGAKLVSLAPANWEDGYFIRLFQRIGACHADIRGPSTLFQGAQDRAAHLADPQAIAAAIEAVQQPGLADFRDVTVDGEAMPRRLGRALLSYSFGAGGNVPQSLTGAWSAAEPTHRWSLGPVSGVTLPRDRLAGDGPFWLEIAGQGHVYPPHLPTRPLQILASGIDLGRFDVIGRTAIFCRIPRAALAGGGDLPLTFVHPVCPSPRAMGAGEDDRALGFGFERICLYSAVE